MTTKRQVKASKTQKARPEKPKKSKATKAEVAEGKTEAKERPQPKKKFDVEFYRDWCKGCGICAAFCPSAALSMNEKGEPETAQPDLCIGCAWCEIRCPDFAVSVRERKEEVCEL
ncbi:MAG: 4Fe-4S binding protein [Deltaproteobacteria bacterium]|nr:MAG: 4Fe-4S binding protein [Deltaproteobacteria bacterium]